MMKGNHGPKIIVTYIIIFVGHCLAIKAFIDKLQAT